MTRFEEIFVKKRDGRLEKIDLEKIHRVIEWAHGRFGKCVGIAGGNQLAHSVL